MRRFGRSGPPSLLFAATEFRLQPSAAVASSQAEAGCAESSDALWGGAVPPSVGGVVGGFAGLPRPPATPASGPEGLACAMGAVQCPGDSLTLEPSLATMDVQCLDSVVMTGSTQFSLATWRDVIVGHLVKSEIKHRMAGVRNIG